MQHDLYHIYTVDAHTMMLVRNLRRYFLPNFQHDFPLIGRVVERIDKIELLYLGAIFHDLGKGLGGDHSSLGAEHALQFCQQIGLGAEDYSLVVWLVQNHLLMSTTSQRKDISSPDVIREFAEQVQTTRQLDYLLLLTTADIKSTAPKLLNSWRASLLQQLYLSTYAVLEEGINVESDVRQTIEAKKRATATNVLEQGHRVTNLDHLWSDTNDRFVLNQSVEMLSAIAIALPRSLNLEEPIVLLKQSQTESDIQNLYDLFICINDRKRLFADTVSVLSHMNLQVMSARISTGPSGLCYDAFVVMTPDGGKLSDTDAERTTSVVVDC